MARRSLCHNATTTAFTAAQAFHKRGDWRVRREAETGIVAEMPELAGGVADDEALGMLSNTEGGGKLHAS
jgi:hypothetical protein